MRECERESANKRERERVKCNFVLWHDVSRSECVGRMINEHDNPVTRETNVQECKKDESACNPTLPPQFGPALCPS